MKRCVPETRMVHPVRFLSSALRIGETNGLLEKSNRTTEHFSRESRWRIGRRGERPAASVSAAVAPRTAEDQGAQAVALISMPTLGSAAGIGSLQECAPIAAI